MTDHGKPDRLIVCITGDIDYFNRETEDCLESYVSMLRDERVTAEFFITAKAAKEFPERVELLRKRGHIIGGHGDIHEGFSGPVSVQTERLKAMMKMFDDALGLAIEGFRAPWYKHDRNTYLAVERAGLHYDCSKKRFEIAFKRVPFYGKRYIFTRSYPLARPLLQLIGTAYNSYCLSPPHPYLITPGVTEFPTLGISDYSLIDDPRGPQYLPEDSLRLGAIWAECLDSLRKRGGGGVMTIQAHPGRMSPFYLPGLELFIHLAKKMGAEFSTPFDLCIAP